MPAKRDGELLILAVGDVHVNRSDPPSVFADVASVLKQGDIVIANLEGSNSDVGRPVDGKIEIGSSHMRSAPRNAQALTAAGVNVVGMANNHNMDFGPDALLQNISQLDSLKIAHAGGGANFGEAHRPAIKECNGVTVAMLSYTSIYIAGAEAGKDKAGLATIKINTSYQPPENIRYAPGVPPLIATVPDPADLEQMTIDVQKSKQRADVVIVAFHWGVSKGHNNVVGFQKELGRAAIDAGADMVLGSHPHRLQGIEIYNSKPICYCLGNFVLDGQASRHFGADTMIFKCQIEQKQIKRCSFIPTRLSDQWQPYVLKNDQIGEVMERMEAISDQFGTTFRLEDGEIVVGGPRPGTPPAKRGFAIEPHRGLPVLVDALITPPDIEKKLDKAYRK